MHQVQGMRKEAESNQEEKIMEDLGTQESVSRTEKLTSTFNEEAICIRRTKKQPRSVSIQTSKDKV
jgi:hypothetical protein